MFLVDTIAFILRWDGRKNKLSAIIPKVSKALPDYVKWVLADTSDYRGF